MLRMSSVLIGIGARRIVAAGSVLILVAILGGALSIWDLRRNAIDASRQNISNLGIVLAEQLSRSIQAVDLVMIVTNDDGMQHLLSSKFKLGADASAAAGPVGRNAGADTDWKMRAEVLTYSRARGIFAGIDLNGSAVTQDKDETRILYGSPVPFTDILGGKVRAREESAPFLAAIRRYSGQAREHGELKPSAGTVRAASR